MNRKIRKFIHQTQTMDNINHRQELAERETRLPALWQMRRILGDESFKWTRKQVEMAYLSAAYEFQRIRPF